MKSFWAASCTDDCANGLEIRLGIEGSTWYFSYQDGEQGTKVEIGGSEADTNWTHVAVTFNTTNLTFLYVNGQRVGTGDIGSSDQHANHTFKYGNVGRSFSEPYLGQMDDLMVWNRTLSEGEINQLYMTNLQKFDPDSWALTVNQTFNASRGLVDGTYTHRVHVQDLAGNENSTSQRSFIVGIPAPFGNKFVFTNSSGAVVASVDERGYMYLLGNLTSSQNSLFAPNNSLIVQNSSAHAVAYINTSGSMFLTGTLSELDDLTSSGTKLEIRNSSSDLVAFVDSSGNLKLRKQLFQNYATP